MRECSPVAASKQSTGLRSCCWLLVVVVAVVDSACVFCVAWLKFELNFEFHSFPVQHTFTVISLHECVSVLRVIGCEQEGESGDRLTFERGRQTEIDR